MAKEEFTVRIGRKGEIFVETGNLPPQRIKDLLRYLEDTMGPAKLVEADDGATGREEIDLTQSEEEETEERQRLRMRNEE